MQEKDLIDVKKGIMYCGDDEDIYYAIIESFCRDGKKRIASIESSLENEDFSTYEREVHSLKSVAATIGATVLSEMATKLNTACKKKDFLVAKKGGSELIHLYEEVILYLESLYQEKALQT
ncbi:MAG TPA: Hpt domain-containing protein [Lachnospiraceae bacterium]|nr:Hpt domain-containing protein [Lachnospiraceae bacterium]